MKITTKDYQKVLHEYTFDIFPRSVGNPKQSFIVDIASMFRFIKQNNGKRPCFTSTNAYARFDSQERPDKIFMDKNAIDYDVDSGNTLKEVKKDVLAGLDYLEESKISYLVDFSGDKGFHTFPLFKGEIRTIDLNLATNIKVFQNYMKTQLKLRSLDLHCAEARRLIRIPLSKHVKQDGTGAWICNPYYCIPLTRKALEDMSIDEIKQLATKPTAEYCMKRPKELETFRHCIKRLGLDDKKIMEEYMVNETTEFIEYKDMQSGDFVELTKLLIPNPCLHMGLFDSNPRHIVRLSACIWLKTLISQEKAIEFFDTAAEVANWNDKDNRRNRLSHIKSVYRGEYSPVSCKRLISEGLCIGNKCKKFKEVKLDVACE